MKRIALIGESDLEKKAHRGIEASIDFYRRDVDSSLDYEWIPSASITPESLSDLFRKTTGFWCVPGSPYESTVGALLAIQHARTQGKTFLGTCGGFQHGLMEFAQNVLGHTANHQEQDEAPEYLIVQLSCSLAGATGKVIATVPKMFSNVLGAQTSVEEFNCNYGFNSDFKSIFEGSDLVFVAHDELGQARAFRLKNHPFFVGTLFQPERKALTGTLHPVVRAFFDAV